MKFKNNEVDSVVVIDQFGRSAEVLPGGTWYSHLDYVAKAADSNDEYYGLDLTLVTETDLWSPILAVESAVGRHAVAASGTCTVEAGNCTDGDTLTVDAITYRFKDTPAQAYDVDVGADAATSAANLVAAIMLTAPGDAPAKYYATGTLIHPTVSAVAGEGAVVTLTAKTAGAAGNALAFTTTDADDLVLVTAPTLAGGIDLVDDEIALYPDTKVISVRNGNAGTVTVYINSKTLTSGIPVVQNERLVLSIDGNADKCFKLIITFTTAITSGLTVVQYNTPQPYLAVT